MRLHAAITFFFALGQIVALGGPANKEQAQTIYSPVGKRDPFRAPSLGAIASAAASVNPVEKYSLEQLQLRAILRSDGRARAMLEDPEGRTHIVTEGDIVGRERATLSKILNTEIIVTERTFNYLGQQNLYEKVLSLPDEGEEFAPYPMGRSHAGGASGADVDSFTDGSRTPVAPAAPGGLSITDVARAAQDAVSRQITSSGGPSNGGTSNGGNFVNPQLPQNISGPGGFSNGASFPQSGGASGSSAPPAAAPPPETSIKGDSGGKLVY